MGNNVLYTNTSRRENTVKCNETTLKNGTIEIVPVLTPGFLQELDLRNGHTKVDMMV
jgi:hypothetical protein